MCANVFLPFSLFDLAICYADRLASNSIFNSDAGSFKRAFLLEKKYISVPKFENWEELKLSRDFPFPSAEHSISKLNSI